MTHTEIATALPRGPFADERIAAVRGSLIPNTETRKRGCDTPTGATAGFFCEHGTGVRLFNSLSPVLKKFRGKK